MHRPFLAGGWACVHSFSYSYTCPLSHRGHAPGPCRLTWTGEVWGADGCEMGAQGFPHVVQPPTLCPEHP